VSNEELFAATAINTWNTMTSRLERTLSSLTDDELQLEVAPGRNRAYYILGHLTAFQDRLLHQLGLGERLYPELDDLFVTKPDRSYEDTFTGAELRRMFAEITSKVTSGIQAMPPADLLKRHESVSEQDFAKEPLRNRVAVLSSAMTHMMLHAGQIRLVLKT
jgi:DinB superfamily